MPAHGNGLKQKTFSGEAVDILPFVKFLGGKAVAIGGKFAFDIWFCQPATTEESGFCLYQL